MFCCAQKLTLIPSVCRSPWSKKNLYFKGVRIALQMNAETLSEGSNSLCCGHLNFLKVIECFKVIVEFFVSGEFISSCEALVDFEPREETRNISKDGRSDPANWSLLQWRTSIITCDGHLNSSWSRSILWEVPLVWLWLNDWRSFGDGNVPLWEDWGED